MLKKYVPLLLVIAVFTTFHISRGDTHYEGMNIVDVEFKGLLLTDTLTVRSVIETKPRSVLTFDRLDKDIKALYNLDLFSDIQVDVREAEGGVIVTFVFDELPTIREIIIRGNRKVSDRQIKEAILLKPESVFNEEDALADVQSIVDLYEEKGRPDTSVDYEVVDVVKTDRKTGEEIKKVDLIFNVKESRKVIVKSIVFSGVTVFDEKKLKRQMDTKERKGLRAGFFKETDFALDRNHLEEYYGEHGYIDASIVKVDRKATENEKRKREELDLTIYIEEGEQYTFGGVELSGNEIFTDEELLSFVTLQKGDVFDQTAWETSLKDMRNLLASNGYIYFDMRVEENRDRDNRVISFTIDLKENSRAHIENIYITGNAKTKDFVISRELEVYEGEIFNSSKINRSREKLYNLQYFSVVNIDVKPGTELGLVDLIFNVEEQKTGLFSFGLTYSTAGYGIAFFEEVTARNFLGRGLSLHEKVEVGFVRTIVEVGLDEPWLFNTPTSAGITLSYGKVLYGSQTGDDVYIWDPTYKNPESGVYFGRWTTPGGDVIEIPYGAVPIDNGDGTYTIDYTDAQTMEYIQNSFSTSFRLGRRFGKYYGANSQLAFTVYHNEADPTVEVDNVETADAGDTTVLPAIPYEDTLRDDYEAGYPTQWKNSLSLTVYRDSRDISWWATRGSYLAQNVTMVGGFLGGDNHFINPNTEINLNFRTFSKFVLSTRLNVGFIYPWLGRPLSIDDSDYLRIDALNEGRGWQHTSQFINVSAERGRAELNLSLEHRYPVAEHVFWLLMFFDASGIWRDPKDFTLDPKELYYSVGVGASVIIPFFPIRFYLARRFAYDESKDKFRLANSQTFFRNWDFVFAVAGYF